MPQWLSTPVKRYRAVLVGLLLTLILVLFFTAWTALVPFFLGVFLAYLLLPIVNFFDSHAPKFLQRRRISRPLAIILVYILLLAVVAGVLAYFIPAVISQAKVFGDVAPGYFKRLQSLVEDDLAAFLNNVPPDIRKLVDTNLERASGALLDGLQMGLEATFSALTQTISFIVGMVIVPFWLFYVLNDADKVRRGFYDLIPEAAREDVRCIISIIDGLLSSYVRGQLLLALLVGLMATIALLILGVDLALLLGTFAGIFEMIPILGPYLGAIPAILMALLNRPITAFWVAVTFFAIQQFENVFLVPRISGNAVRFHPALVMIVLVVGSEVAGLWGMLLALPLAAILRDVFRYLYLRTTERGATPEMALEFLRASSPAASPFRPKFRLRS
jgi:predicted PurR-regulated permease PerM